MAAPADQDDAKAVAATSATILLLYVASLLIPAIFTIAGIRITPSRLLLILLIVPLALRFLRDRENPINTVDILIIAYIAWSGLAILVNHGLGRAVFVVSSTIDEFGAYLIGRMLIRNAVDYRLFFKYVFWGLLFLFPFALIELLTKTNLIFVAVEAVLGRAGRPSYAGQAPRLGLNRVQAAFHHSILFGVFCAVGIANLFYIYKNEFFKRWTRTSLAAAMTFMSLSSAPLIAMAIQGALMVWGWISGMLPGRWIVLGVTAAFTAVFLQLAIEDGVVGLVIEHAVFDERTGWGRMEIFEYGSAEALESPVFGIGLGEWVRPYWRKSSVDNFWLVLAMRYGIPAAAFLMLALLVHFVRVTSATGLSAEAARHRTGYMVAWAGLFFTLATVHFFGAMSLFLMTYIGAGAWFYERRRGGDESARRQSGRGAARRRPERERRAAHRAKAPDSASTRLRRTSRPRTRKASPADD